jgi:hypothetical protein
VKKILTIMVISSILLIPISASAAEGDPCSDASGDARRDVSGALWFTLGCLFGVFGVGAAYLFAPSPQVTNLVGKSSDYVSAYTDCYKEHGRSLQTKKAFNGCLIWSLVVLLGGGGIALSGCAGI